VRVHQCICMARNRPKQDNSVRPAKVLNEAEE
jgi:hypothetical protein